MTPRRIFFSIAVLFLGLVVTTIETPAKNKPGVQRSLDRANTRSDSVDKEQLRPTSKRLGTPVQNFTLSKRDLAKVINAAVKKCSCASPTAAIGWGSCFRDCLESYGVSPASAAACAAACTANPVGCAICAGIHQWIVMGCAQYCVWRNVVGLQESSMSKTPARPTKNGPRTHPVKLSRAASLS